MKQIKLLIRKRYRNETTNGFLDMFPDISYRYLAVRSGVGHFCMSGNVITKDGGASVFLGSVRKTVFLLEEMPKDRRNNINGFFFNYESI